MDLARWSNIVALDAAYRRGASELPAGPLEAYVEVAARCNLRCAMCPITVDPRYQPASGRPGLLADALFEQLEPLLPTLQRVYLQGLGEPTLHPRLAEYTERLAAAGVEVWVTTNATLIEEEQADALARAGLARVTVSIDAATAATYERIRRQGRFADVLRGLRRLAAAKRRYGRPALFVSMVGMAGNLHELPDLVDLCAELGGDGVFLEGLYAWPHSDLEAFAREERLERLGTERVAALVEQARRRAEQRGLGWWSRLEEIGLAATLAPPIPPPAGEPSSDARAAAPALTPPPVFPWRCSEPWATIVIGASGEVRTCCFSNAVFGNLAEQSFAEVWNGARYREMRRQMAAGQVPAGCTDCVRAGRVKRSGQLGWRSTVARAAGDTGWQGLLLDAPLDGELVGAELVIVGRRPRASLLSPLHRPLLRDELPEVWIDDTLVARLADSALLARCSFAATIPIPFVSAGAHELSLRLPAAGEERRLPSRHLQVGSPQLPDGHLAAVHTLALPLTLDTGEAAPELWLDGARHPLGAWLCGRHGPAWLAFALIDLGRLAAGKHALELRFRRHPPERRALWRIAAVG